MKTLRLLLPALVALSAILALAPAARAEAPPTFQFAWGTPGSGDGQFDTPIAVVIDHGGDVYVTEISACRLQKFTSTGTYITQWGSLGTEPGQFWSPFQMALDAAGNVFVADAKNSRIQKFTAAGVLITTWGTYGTGPGEFVYAPGVAVDGAGDVYVSDCNGNRIEKFTSDGTYLLEWGSSGSGNGEFNYPYGLAVDAGGNVYVVDTANDRIQKFTSDGTYLTQWGTSGSGDGEFANPVGIAIDASGNVYVADVANNRVQKFTAGGAFLAKWGSPGSADGEFQGPFGVAISGSGDIYVTDYNNNRVQVFGYPPPEHITAVPDPALCISSVHPCVTVPVDIAYSGPAPIRGYSVTFTLSPELSLCDSLVAERPYLRGVADTYFDKRANGGGSYTVDCAILGATCGATGNGTLFVLKLASATASATGTVTINSVTVRDCDNDSIPVFPGAPADILIDNTSPPAIADLAAVQQRTGNPAGATTRIQLTWSGVAAEDSVRIFRAGFGHYPEFDDAGGVAPSAPGAYLPGAPWSAVATVAGGGGGGGGYADLPGTRDYFYYAAYVTDPCGNVSAVSNRTSGTLDYHLGDVSNGATPGVGNDAVFTEDISLLGLHYGIALALDDTLNYLDVGPTTNHHVDGRPTTDNRVNFEDLMMFALNHGQVSKPRATAKTAARDEVALEVAGDAAVGATLTARLGFEGTGRIQGLSAVLGWNPVVVEPLGATAGELLASQGGVAFSPQAGCVDAAVLGTARGLTGTGTLATVGFRRIAEGDPGIVLAAVDARDTRNERVDLATGVPAVTAPVATGLRSVAPNPFRGSTTVEYGLASAGPVELSVHSVDGRTVAVLWSGAREPGVYRATWNGLGQHGEAMPAGVYFVRLACQGREEARKIGLTR